jgi:hypothetical protein
MGVLGKGHSTLPLISLPYTVSNVRNSAVKARITLRLIPKEEFKHILFKN